jgi:hypothetical protein
MMMILAGARTDRPHTRTQRASSCIRRSSLITVTHQEMFSCSAIILLESGMVWPFAVRQHLSCDYYQ